MSVPPPRIFGGGEEEDSEGRIPHSFHRRLRMTLDWMCTVYCSVDILLLVTLRMALNQTHERGSKAQVHDVRVSLLAFSAEGLERPVPPQNAVYRCFYCVLYLARAFMLLCLRLRELHYSGGMGRRWRGCRRGVVLCASLLLR
jgi:hypothetical protein